MRIVFLKLIKKKLKLNVVFEEEENEEEGEKENGSIKGNGISIKIKLYQSNDGLLLKLFKVDGSKKNFYDKFIEISKIVKKCF